MPFNEKNTRENENTGAAGNEPAAGNNGDMLADAGDIARKAAAKAEASLSRSEKAAVRREAAAKKTAASKSSGKSVYRAGDRARPAANVQQPVPRPAPNARSAANTAVSEDARAAGVAERLAAVTAAKSAVATGQRGAERPAQPIAGKPAPMGADKLAAARAAREEAIEKRSKAARTGSIYASAVQEGLQQPEDDETAQAVEKAAAPAPGSIYAAAVHGESAPAPEPLEEEPHAVPISEVDIWAVDAVAAAAAAADENDDNRLMGVNGEVGAALAEITGIGRAPKNGKEKKKTKKASKRERTSFPENSWEYSRSPFAAIGNLLYLLGFYAECKVVMALRFLRDLGIFISQILVWMFGGIFRSIGSFFASIGHDLAAPFLRAVNGVKNIRKAMNEARARGHGSAGAKDAAMGYLANGVRNYKHLVRNLLGLFLPVGAVAVLGIVIYAIFGVNYGLAVQVDGQTIGYVTDRTVVEEAKSILRDRLKLSDGQEIADLQVNPDLAIAKTTEFTSKDQLVNEMLMVSGVGATDGTGLEIDGKVVAATKEGEGLRDYLDKKLDEAADPENPDAKISFVNDVECDPEKGDVFFPDTLKSLDEITELLESNISEEEVYSAQPGEVLNDIAHANDIGYDELVKNNAALEGKESDYALEEPMELVVQEAQPYLQVKKTIQVFETETIPFETKEEDSAEFDIGQNFIVQAGEDGEREACYNYVYIDGELVAKNLVSSKTVVHKEPVDQVIEIGTREPAAGSDTAGAVEGAFEAKNIPSISGSGTYIFPLPSALFSSRGGGPGTGHRGRDINAAHGAPIFAAGSGVVVKSEYHYSWGNYVQIQHPDGLLTLYAHCSSLGVSVGQTVQRGDYIAAIGSTGFSTGPHLHLELWTSPDANSYINPDTVIPCPFA